MQASTGIHSSARPLLEEIVRPSIALPVLILVASVAVAIISEEMAVRGFLAITAILTIAYFCVRKPHWGCVFIVFMTLVLDDTIRQFSTITHDLGFYFYRNWWKFISSENVRKFDLLKLNTVEVLMIAIGIGVVLQAKREKLHLVLTPELILGLAFLATVAVMFFWGIFAGGEPKQALWQVRSYFQLVAISILVTQTTRTEQDLRPLTWALIAGASIKAAQVIGIFFFMAEGQFGSWRQIVGHEDSIFFVAALSLIFALQIYDQRLTLRLFLSCLSAILATAIVLNLRRAGYAAAGLAMVLMPFVAHDRRKLAAGATLALTIAALAYLLLFWHSTGTLGVPAQKVRSIFAASSGTSDYNSNIYRAAENINLSHTIVRNPFGTGFGKPFEILVPVDDISRTSPDWQYHPHNMVLGLWMSLGTIGFIIYLTFITGAMTAAIFAAKHSASSFIKAVAVFGVLALTTGLFAGAVDGFIWAQRGALFLGIVIGLISSISAMQGRTFRLPSFRNLRTQSLKAQWSADDEQTVKPGS